MDICNKSNQQGMLLMTFCQSAVFIPIQIQYNNPFQSQVWVPLRQAEGPFWIYNECKIIFKELIPAWFVDSAGYMQGMADTW